METKSYPILVWGIAGASLGIEIVKCLTTAGYRKIIGCDISPLAYGHFSGLFHSTYVLDRESMQDSLVGVLSEAKPKFVLAGGDQIARILPRFNDQLVGNDCRICGNSREVVELASDKYTVMVRLQQAGFEVPDTRLLEDMESVKGMRLPVVFKPRFDSGGSRGVFVVSSRSELVSRAASILGDDTLYIVQEYISDEAGEYTIGVLCDSDQTVAGSILLRRTFQNMLSVHERTENFLISSGSSQGIFERNETLQLQAEGMAAALGSTGPLNIQARVRQGQLLPFEINPRFSASTYLRALSGVNEVDLYIQHLSKGTGIEYPAWKEGLALRTFGEVFVEKGRLPENVL